MQAAAHNVAGPIQGGQHLGHADGIALQLHIPAIGRGSGLLARQGGGSHLAAGHAKVGVVDEDDRDVFTAGGGMNDLARPDGGQIAIALIGKDDPVGQDAFDAGRHGWRATMCGFHKVCGEIVIGEDRAAHRRHADGTIDQTHLIQYFGDQTVGNAMRTTRAVMGGSIRKGQGTFVNQVFGGYHRCHIYLYFFITASMRCSQTLAGSSTILGVSPETRWISPRISSGNGTTPPRRP